jgi:hydrogenase maturation protein HypF
LRALAAAKIRVVGLVQGVGFRPFIHRLAAKLGLSGYVRNMGGSEVLIFIEGDEASVREFPKRMMREKPPPAKIEELTVEEAEPQGLTGFVIMKSAKSITARSAIPPDFGICEDCIREIKSVGDRRSGYHWNSCAWCGPRYSMMYKLPYDRENTSMGKYRLCPECRKEYEDLENVRRYHAQGISCPACGPRTFLLDSEGRRLNVRDPLREAAKLLEEGHVIAIKGLGGYHIAGLASDDVVVERIRKIKWRPTQPLALMARDCNVASRLVELEEGDCDILWSPERPILLLKRRPDAPVSELVAPGLDTLGVMMPYTGLQVLLLDMVRDGFLIMTSGNKHGLPMCTNLDCLLDQLGGEVDYILEHDREIVHRVDDSVLRKTRGWLVFLRRSRGYAPYWIRVPLRLVELVALGAELQTAGAVAFEDKVVLTQYIGDLDVPAQLEELEREVKWLTSQYSLKPEVVVVDTHPAYSNRRIAPSLAEEFGADDIVEVQHHHAHAASAIAEWRESPEEPHPAVAVDGTGYGLDGMVWGGEALIVEGESFERVAHIGYYPLPGGDTAAKRPARVAVGILSMGYSLSEVEEILGSLGVLGKGIGEEELRVAYAISKQPRFMASSAGRLIDAIAALLGIAFERTYEGEPAIRLEAWLRMKGARPAKAGEPPVKGSTLDPLGVVEYVLNGIEEGRGAEAAATALYWIGLFLASSALAEVRAPLAFSGGAAVNDYIAEGVIDAAREAGVRVLYNRLVPPGDGGIALGQAVIAGLMARR